MNVTELQSNLQLLTNSKISLAQIGEILNLTRSNMSKRAKNNSEVTVTELQKIEKHFKKSIYKAGCYTLERQNDTTINDKYEQFGIRLTELQDKHEYLDKDMAKLLKMSEDDYIQLKSGNLAPDIQVINRLKQCFEISIDWLLYGE